MVKVGGVMSEMKVCANKEMAIDILEFIKSNYEKHLNEEGQGGCRKYVEALQMGIDALRKEKQNENNNDSRKSKTRQRFCWKIAQGKA